MTSSSRISRAAILAQLKRAARHGDRAALAAATHHMRIWALSPRYWQRYLDLLAHPLARLVDLTVIKQGDRIASQKEWVTGRAETGRPATRPTASAAISRRPSVRREPVAQPSLFPDQAD